MFVPSSLWLALDYFTYFFSYGIFLPYWGAWLKGEGHDVATVGTVKKLGLMVETIAISTSRAISDFCSISHAFVK